MYHSSSLPSVNAENFEWFYEIIFPSPHYLLRVKWSAGGEIQLQFAQDTPVVVLAKDALALSAVVIFRILVFAACLQWLPIYKWNI